MSEKDPNDINAINRIRLDEEKRRKAEVFKAQRDANAARSWFEFIRDHSGTKAVINNDVYHDCVANQQAIEAYIATLPDPTICRAHIEAAFVSLRPKLATASVEPYQRKTNLQESRVVPPTIPTLPPAFIGLTRRQIVELPKDELKKLMQKGPNYRDELDRILARKER
jgi:hypothetical protein